MIYAVSLQRPTAYALAMLELGEGSKEILSRNRSPWQQQMSLVLRSGTVNVRDWQPLKEWWSFQEP